MPSVKKKRMVGDSNCRGRHSAYLICLKRVLRDELVDLCRRRAPKTVKAFTEAFCSKEDPVDILIAFECFPQFSISNKSAICAQSEQMINTLLLMENKFSIDEFSVGPSDRVTFLLISGESQ